MVPEGTSRAALAWGGGADLEETQGTKRGRGRDGTPLCCPGGLSLTGHWCAQKGGLQGAVFRIK